jgi:hypothetical protein
MPDCGVYLVWPEPGTKWIHPDDVTRAEAWIPSNRVFRRHSFDGVYYRLQYGDSSIRVKPTFWMSVPDEHLWLGDQVEIMGDFREKEPSLAEIIEARWNTAAGKIVYTLQQRDLILDRAYFGEELRCLSRRPQIGQEIPYFTIDVSTDSNDEPLKLAPVDS